MIVQEVLRKSCEFLNQKNIESARLDCELLLAFALGWDRLDLYIKSDYPLSEDEISRCRQLIVRRGQGEPVAYLIGEKYFFDHRFFVQPGVLIPRPETELIVEEAIKWCKDLKVKTDQDVQDNLLRTNNEKIKIVDLGFGSGCIGLSILHHIPNATLVGFDSSELALSTARLNAEKMNLSSQVQFILTDVNFLSENHLTLVRQSDVLVANPPYISHQSQEIDSGVRLYEPPNALYAEREGMEAIEQWSDLAKTWLKPGGLMLFEIGFDQGAKALSWFEKLDIFSEVKILKDFSQLDRVVKATVRSSHG